MAGGGPQKPEHGGNFYMVPRRLQDSPAWRHLSLRARVVLQVLQYRHDGFNNGRLAITVHELSAAVGDQNHGANGKALAELIEKGFVECTTDANRHQAKARTYRLTFIPTGEGKRTAPATHEYREWRPGPGDRRKFGGAKTATRSPVLVTETATIVKFPVTETATQPTAIAGFEPNCRVAETAPLLGNQSPRKIPGSDRPVISRSGVVQASAAVDLDELRGWLRLAIDRIGYGAQKRLAAETGISEPTLSRFRAGRGLPEHYRIPLQTACARIIPHTELVGVAV